MHIQNKEYKLYYDFRALVEMERISGQKISEIQHSLQSLTGIGQILYCGLMRHHSQEIQTIEAAYEIIELDNLQYIVDSISMALGQAFGSQQ